MMLDSLPPFDPDFASPAEWAQMYRANGVQVIPSPYPMRVASDKRPQAAEWKEFQNELVPDALFQKWFPPTAKPNMGAIAGAASGGLLVIDLDEYKPGVGPVATAWWNDVTGGVDPETWQQRTGGGGRQIFFRLPPGVSIGNASAHALGVDIRGQGGFALMPPTLHMSGNNYQWIESYEPWSIPLDIAPQRVIDAVLDLAGTGLEASGASGPVERTASPGAVTDAFGSTIDGREEKMRDMVWARVLDLRRDHPTGIPDQERMSAEFSDLWQTYERTTKTRLPGVDNASGLEREARGISAMSEHWRRALKKWDGDIAREAEKPRPFDASLSLTKGDLRDSTALVSHTPQPIDPETGKPLPLILTAAQFVAGFTPPAYLIDGMLQRGYLYSCTARTGHGKTAVAMFIAQSIARGLPIKGRAVKQGSVLILAGENPDDVRARYLVLAEAMGFPAGDAPIHFVAGVINIEESLPVIRAEAEAIPDLMLVIVDTAAAYFRGDDGNSNAQAGAYARVLRALTFLPGKPAVLVNSHPVKNAGRDNLLPVGGGAFLNEVDGNLTLWSEGERETTLHWQGKFRGPEFEPISFKLDIATAEAVADEAGVLLPSVVARPISDVEAEASAMDRETDARILLAIIANNAPLAVAMLAKKAGWETPDGKPLKSKVHRLIMKLRDHKLVDMDGLSQKWRATSSGRKAIGMDHD